MPGSKNRIIDNLSIGCKKLFNILQENIRYRRAIKLRKLEMKVELGTNAVWQAGEVAKTFIKTSPALVGGWYFLKEWDKTTFSEKVEATIKVLDKCHAIYVDVKTDQCKVVENTKPLAYKIKGNDTVFIDEDHADNLKSAISREDLERALKEAVPDADSEETKKYIADTLTRFYDDKPNTIKPSTSFDGTETYDSDKLLKMVAEAMKDPSNTLSYFALPEIPSDIHDGTGTGGMGAGGAGAGGMGSGSGSSKFDATGTVTPTKGTLYESSSYVIRICKEETKDGAFVGLKITDSGYIPTHFVKPQMPLFDSEGRFIPSKTTPDYTSSMPLPNTVTNRYVKDGEGSTPDYTSSMPLPNTVTNRYVEDGESIVTINPLKQIEFNRENTERLKQLLQRIEPPKKITVPGGDCHATSPKSLTLLDFVYLNMDIYLILNITVQCCIVLYVFNTQYKYFISTYIQEIKNKYAFFI